MEQYKRCFEYLKQWNIFKYRILFASAMLLIMIFCMNFVPVRAEETAIEDSYEKTVTRTYSFGDGDIPVSIEYSEYDDEMKQEYAGTLYMKEGEMQKGFHFCAVYEGTLNRIE